MLVPSEVSLLKEELVNCSRPLFLYHDDPDGLASFILCYRFIKEGRGLPVKAFPRVTVDLFARKVHDYGADKVFILDVALVDQEFVDQVKVPIVWVDHHEPQKVDNVKYLNPRVSKGVNVPTPALIWQVVSGERPQDLWLAVVGAIGDWYFPDYAKTFQEAYPSLLPKTVRTPEEALFTTKLGILVKLFSFVLKGSMKDVLQSVKILSRIDDPFEILDQTSPRGRFLWKRYKAVNEVYEKMLAAALSNDSDDKLFVYTYEDDQLSLTKDIANELLYKLKKVIVVGREKEGELRCSLRAPSDVQLKEALEKALVGIDGYGGGHEHACGAGIKKDDFEQFLNNLRDAI